MLYLHGGGCVHGVAEQFASVIKAYIDAAPCIVVAADCGKASQALHPVAFDDSYDTLLWLRDNAAALGGRDTAFIVAGHSAGGGLAAAVSLKACDTGQVQVAFQIPVYPMLDDRGSSASMRGNAAAVRDEVANAHALAQYLRGGQVEAYAVPARAGDAAGLPRRPSAWSAASTRLPIRRGPISTPWSRPGCRSPSRCSMALCMPLTAWCPPRRSVGRRNSSCLATTASSCSAIWAEAAQSAHGMAAVMVAMSIRPSVTIALKARRSLPQPQATVAAWRRAACMAGSRTTGKCCRACSREACLLACGTAARNPSRRTGDFSVACRPVAGREPR